MDALDIGVLSGLVGYALGYVHRGYVTKDTEDGFVDSAIDCARYGLAIMMGEDANNVDCMVDIDGEKVTVHVSKS